MGALANATAFVMKMLGANFFLITKHVLPVCNVNSRNP